MFFPIPGSGIPMNLTTKRLILRPMAQSDAPALFAILGDAEAMRFWQRPPIRRLAVVEEMVREQIAAGPLCRYWTVWRDGDAIGSCDLSFISPEDGQAQTGFLFRRDQWGHGLAGEAMTAVTAHAFGPLGLSLLAARTHVENRRARRLLERLGFALDRIEQSDAPGIPMPVAVYLLHP
jgi:RimJ/RimL family protein N-acetyltransferase